MLRKQILKLFDEVAPSVALAIRADDPHLVDSEDIDDDIVRLLIEMVCVSRYDINVAERIIDGYRLLANQPTKSIAG